MEYFYAILVLFKACHFFYYKNKNQLLSLFYYLNQRKVTWNFKQRCL